MNAQRVAGSPREIAAQKYATARANLLLMLALTVFNIVLFFAGSDSMMLFSATVPYVSVVWGQMYAAEFGVPMVLYIGIAIAAVSVLAYLLCWIFSKKHYGWMIAALVLFVLDTLAMLAMYLWLIGIASGILDILIHIWVLYYLILGVRNGYDLKHLPAEDYTKEEEADIETMPASAASMAEESENTRPLRMADTDAKARVFIETTANGKTVSFRRVKRTNELVINGYVYGEVEMLVEPAHQLTATIDGHTYTAGYDGAIHSFIKVDGVTVAKKLRLW